VPFSNKQNNKAVNHVAEYVAIGRGHCMKGGVVPVGLFVSFFVLNSGISSICFQLIRIIVVPLCAKQFAVHLHADELSAVRTEQHTPAIQ